MTKDPNPREFWIVWDDFNPTLRVSMTKPGSYSGGGSGQTIHVREVLNPDPFLEENRRLQEIYDELMKALRLALSALETDQHQFDREIEKIEAILIKSEKKHGYVKAQSNLQG